MKKIIVANWKMYGDQEMAKNWAAGMREHLTTNHEPRATIIVCPPAALISMLKNELANLPVKIGGQDCHEQEEGAHTGDTSAKLLKSIACEYVIVGHSERRQNHAETSALICKKAACAIKSELIPIICIGETADERAKGATISVLTKQIAESVPSCHPEQAAGVVKDLCENNKNKIPHVDFMNGQDPSLRLRSAQNDKPHFILAYEPVWAIGSGNVPNSDEIKNAHLAIISATSKHTGLAEAEISVLYGGSVKPENAAEILTIEGVAGVLVGGASLKAEDFWKIAASGH